MTTSIQKVIAYHISRLQDKNRDVRLKAITELSLYADQEAFNALRSIFENDADNEVRKAAQGAGRAMFVKLKNQDSDTP